MIWKKLCDFTRFLSIRLYVTMPSGNGEVKRLNRRNSPTTGWTHLWILLGLCRKALPSWVSKADSFLGSNLSSTFQKANLRSSLSWTSQTSRFCRPFTGRIKRIDLAGQQALASSRTRTTPWSQMRVDARIKIGPFWAMLTCVSSSGTIYKLPKTNKLLNSQETSVFWRLRVQHPQCLEKCNPWQFKPEASDMTVPSPNWKIWKVADVDSFCMIFCPAFISTTLLHYTLYDLSLLSLLGKPPTNFCSPTQ